MKEVSGPDFMRGMSTQSHYRYIRAAKKMLRKGSVFVQEEGLNGNDTGLKSLGIAHLHDIGLYTATMEALEIFIRAARDSVKNSNNSAPFHTPTFYTSAKTFLRKCMVLDKHNNQLMLAFVEHHANSSKCVDFLNTPMSLTRTTRIFLLQMSFICMRLHTYEARDRKGSWKAWSEGLQH